ADQTLFGRYLSPLSADQSSVHPPRGGHRSRLRADRAAGSDGCVARQGQLHADAMTERETGGFVALARAVDALEAWRLRAHGRVAGLWRDTLAHGYVRGRV